MLFGTEMRAVHVVVVVATVLVLMAGVIEDRLCLTDDAGDLDVNEKQKAVVQFLAAQKAAPDLILERLGRVYGNETVRMSDVEEWIKVEENTINWFVWQRAVIQFLTAEGVRPIDIWRWLNGLYGNSCLEYTNVWHWTRQFRLGRISIFMPKRGGRGHRAPDDKVSTGTPEGASYWELRRLQYRYKANLKKRRYSVYTRTFT